MWTFGFVSEILKPNLTASSYTPKRTRAEREKRDHWTGCFNSSCKTCSARWELETCCSALCILGTKEAADSGVLWSMMCTPALLWWSLLPTLCEWEAHNFVMESNWRLSGYLVRKPCILNNDFHAAFSWVSSIHGSYSNYQVIILNIILWANTFS